MSSSVQTPTSTPGLANPAPRVTPPNHSNNDNDNINHRNNNNNNNNNEGSHNMDFNNNPRGHSVDDELSSTGSDVPFLHARNPGEDAKQAKFVARNNHAQILADRLSIALGIEAFGALAMSGARTWIGNNPAGLPTMGMIYLCFIIFGGAQSGAHLNPAITLAYYIRGKINLPMAILYCLVHFVFAILGSILVYGIVMAPSYAETVYGHKHITMLAQPHVLTWQLWFYEFFYTFWLVMFYLIKTTTYMSRNSTFYYIYMGGYMAVALTISGCVTPGLLNPAIAIGNAIPAAIVWGGGNLRQLWVYLVAEFAASICAASAFVFMSEQDRKREWREEGHGNLHYRAY